MTANLAQTLRVLNERADGDDALAETLRFLAEDAAGPPEPFADPGPAVRDAARSINRRRQREWANALDAHTLDSSEVVDLIASISDRRGVDRRRRRGRLMGWRVGRRTLHPDWQFDRRRGETRPGLEQILVALAEVAPDPVAAHALMTSPREDLDGRTLADLFASGRIETVSRVILASGDQA